MQQRVTSPILGLLEDGKLRLAAISTEARVRAALEASDRPTYGEEFDGFLARGLGLSIPDVQNTIDNLEAVPRASVKAATAGPSEGVQAMTATLNRIGPSPERTIISLHFHEELSFVEIGQILDIDSLAVKRELTKALFRLSAEMNLLATQSDRMATEY